MRSSRVNRFTMSRIVLDTVVLAAIIDTRDKWHSTAVALNEAISTKRVELFLIDVVVNETISVLLRRLHEQRRVSQFDYILGRLERFAPPPRITWISSRVQRLYPEV